MWLAPTAAHCSTTGRTRSNAPSTRPAANSTASSINPSAEPQITHEALGRDLFGSPKAGWDGDLGGRACCFVRAIRPDRSPRVADHGQAPDPTFLGVDSAGSAVAIKSGVHRGAIIRSNGHKQLQRSNAFTSIC